MHMLRVFMHVYIIIILSNSLLTVYTVLAFLIMCGYSIIYVTGFWKTDKFVIFDIIYISVYFRHSRWFYWFNKWLNH